MKRSRRSADAKLLANLMTGFPLDDLRPGCSCALRAWGVALPIAVALLLSRPASAVDPVEMFRMRQLGLEELHPDVDQHLRTRDQLDWPMRRLIQPRGGGAQIVRLAPEVLVGDLAPLANHNVVDWLFSDHVIARKTAIQFLASRNAQVLHFYARGLEIRFNTPTVQGWGAPTGFSFLISPRVGLIEGVGEFSENHLTQRLIDRVQNGELVRMGAVLHPVSHRVELNPLSAMVVAVDQTNSRLRSKSRVDFSPEARKVLIESLRMTSRADEIGLQIGLERLQAQPSTEFRIWERFRKLKRW